MARITVVENGYLSISRLQNMKNCVPEHMDVISCIIVQRQIISDQTNSSNVKLKLNSNTENRPTVGSGEIWEVEDGRRS